MAGPNALPMVRAQKVINPSIKAMRDAVKSLVDEDWRLDAAKALGVVKDCPFLLGDNDRKWRMTFEFFVRPGNVDRIVQGNFFAKTGAIATNGVPVPKRDYLTIQIEADQKRQAMIDAEEEQAKRAFMARHKGPGEVEGLGSMIDGIVAKANKNVEEA